MNSVPLRPARAVFDRLASATLLVLALLVLCAATPPSGELLFFLATKNAQQYAKDPQRYDIVSLSPPEPLITYYVERQPTLRIPISAVRSVVLEKAKVYTNLDEGLLEALRLKDKGPEVAGARYYYWATFNLSPGAGRKVTTLSQRFPGEAFELRLGSQRLSVGSFTPPRPGAGNSFNPLTVPIMENDRRRVEDILLPLKDRITWK